MTPPTQSSPDERSPRRRSAPATREAIRQAARARFSTDGYERTTMRAIAADVGVDPAMVVRYYGTKEALFAQAVDLDLGLPDLTGVEPEDLTDALLPHFFRVWEDESTFLALLRASATNPGAAATMRDLFATQTAPTLTAAAVDHPVQRSAVLGAIVLGLALSRNVLQTPALAEMTREELARWLAPLIRWTLLGQEVGDDAGQGRAAAQPASE